MNLHKSHLLADLLESGDCPPDVIQSAATELRRLHGLLVGSNRSVFKRTLEIRRLQDKLYRGLTDDCIVQLAREAGEYQGDHVMTPLALHRFRVLVAAAEREACAQVCEASTDDDWIGSDAWDAAVQQCAAAIRARSKT